MTVSQNRTTKSQRFQTLWLGAIIFGLCILWQLFLMKQVYLEKERYRVRIDNTNYIQQNEYINTENYNRITSNEVESVSQTSGEGEDTPTGISKIENAEILNDESKMTTKTHQIAQSTVSSDTLLDLSVIRNSLLREAPWAESHGANHLAFLGAGLLYYSMAYSFRSQTIVVLGSGGGFVPRMLRQAQRDLLASGVRPERKGNKKRGRVVNSIPSYELYLVDAHLPSAGWGSTFYAENENTTMRKEFSDIHYVFQLTDDAFANYFRPMYDDPKSDFAIDYLHVDADHGFEQSWKDFDNYSQLLSDRAVISFHDTCYDNVTRNCHGDGVPETIEKLRNESQKRGLQIIDLHYLYRGIAFAFREHAMALETPRDRRINFCVNNADLINVTSDGFTKNGRVGSLSTLGDFMNCTERYNETELKLAKAEMTGASSLTNGIMNVPCPIDGFRRSAVSGRCEKCIPGLSGENCQRSKYEALRGKRRGIGNIGSGKAENRDDSDYDDLLHLVGAWLRSLSSTLKSSSANPRSQRPKSVLEIGQNAWKVPTVNSVNNQSSSPLLFGSLMASFVSSSSTANFKANDVFDKVDHIDDIIVVDPLSVTNPLWIDPIISRRYRFLPCTLKDAIDYEEEEKSKEYASKSSSLDLDVVDTLICLSCDDLLHMSTLSATKGFLEATFPSLRTLILGVESNEKSSEFLKGLASEIISGSALTTRTQTTTWQLERDVTMSSGGGSHGRTNTKKRLVLLSRTN
jgi:hypothetical protein